MSPLLVGRGSRPIRGDVTPVLSFGQVLFFSREDAGKCIFFYAILFKLYGNCAYVELYFKNVSLSFSSGEYLNVYLFNGLGLSLDRSGRLNRISSQRSDRIGFVRLDMLQIMLLIMPYSVQLCLVCKLVWFG